MADTWVRVLKDPMQRHKYHIIKAQHRKAAHQAAIGLTTSYFS